MLNAVTALAFAIHIGGGTIALGAGTVAAIARKGGPAHRRAGKVFLVAMLVMAAFAAYLGFVMPGQLVNVFIAGLTAYFVVTGWLAAHRPAGAVGGPERIAAAVSLVLWAPFAVLAFQLATGMKPIFRSAVPFEGPVLIAVYVFTTVLGIAAISDARVALGGALGGVPRVARHLWRMCLGLALAAGSAFTNGLVRLVPASLHVPFDLYFLPQLLPVVLLVFWMLRVRLGGWARPGAPGYAS
jgi:hypothetical protein